MSTQHDHADDVTEPVEHAPAAVDIDQPGAAHASGARDVGDPDTDLEADDLDTDVGDDDLGDEPPPLPIPARRRRLGVVTAVLAFAVVAAIGFYAGVLVQKHQHSSSSSTSNALQALASRFGAGRNATAGNGGAGAAGGAGAGGRGRVAGQVKLVDGPNIYVTDAQGNTVKVATNAGTQVTKSVTGAVGDVKIGDTVVVQGPQGSDGTYQAQRLSIGGAGGGGAGFGGRGGFGGFGGGGGGGAANAASGG